MFNFDEKSLMSDKSIEECRDRELANADVQNGVSAAFDTAYALLAAAAFIAP